MASKEEHEIRGLMQGLAGDASEDNQMSTAVESSSPYADCDEYIEHRIKVARNRIKWTDLLTALLLAGVLLVGYILLFTIFDHWIVTGGFQPFTRAAMLTLVLSVCCYVVYRFVVRPWTREVNSLYAAKMLDTADSGMNGSLLSLVDLKSSGNAGASETIRRTIEKRAAVGLAKVNLDEAIDRRWLMQLGFVLFGLVLSTCLYAVFSPKSINLLRPLSVANSAVATQTRILKVQPGSTDVQAGSEMEVIVDIGGNMPEEVLLMFSTSDRTFVDEQFTMQPSEGEGRFQVLLAGSSDRGLRQNFSYRIIAGDAESEEFFVTVDQPPTANVTQISYRFPDYMTLSGSTTENGNIDTWEGAELILLAEANVPLKSAVVTFSDTPTFNVSGEEFAMDIQGTNLSARFQLNLREDGTSAKYYRIDVTDENGRQDPQPTVYSVTVRPDKPPVVRLIDPIRDLQVASNAIVPLLVEAEDPDFLLRSVKLNYEVNGELRTPEPLFDATRQSLQKSWTGTWEFALAPLELKQGDVVRYYITARDNKPPLGSQSRSGVLQFEIQAPASAEEVQNQLQRDKELQQQQQQDRNSDRTNGDPTKPENNEAAPAEAENQSAANEGNADEPREGDAQQGDQNQGNQQPGDAQQGNKAGNSDQQPGDKNAPGGENGPGKDSGQSNGQQDSTGKPSGDSGQKPNDDPSNDASNGEQSPNQGKPSEKSKAPANDGDAMQRLLESYKETESRKSGGESSDGEAPRQKQSDQDSSDSPKGDDRSTAADSNSKDDVPSGGVSPDKLTGEDSSDPQGKNDQTSDGNANESQKPLDSSTTDKSNGQPADNNVKEPPSTDNKQADSEGQKSDDQQAEDAAQQADGNKSENASKPQEKMNGGKQASEDGAPKNSAEENGAKQGEQQGQNGAKQGEQSGEQQGQNGAKQGDQSGDQQGKDGGEQSGEQQGQNGAKQGEQSGEQQGQNGAKQGEQSGEQQGQNGAKQGEQSGEQQGQNGAKQGDQSGDQQGKDGGKQGDQSGEQQGQNGAKQGDQSGDQQGKDGGKQSEQSGDQQGKDGSKQSEQSGEQQGQNGAKQGEQSGEPAGQGQESGEQGGKPGEGSGGSKSEQGTQGNSGRGGKNPAGGGGANSAGTDQQQPDGEQGDGEGAGNAGEEAAKPFKADDPVVEDAAKAADLVLKRLQKDLDRGTVDKELLEELGWTEDQLKSFSERMQKQIDSLKDDPSANSKAQKLQRRRVEELLKSLDLQAAPQERVGKSDRDIEQQDTTSQRSRPPAQYKDLLELYQRSLSEGRRR